MEPAAVAEGYETVSLTRLSSNALSATTSVLPDMESAATSGLSTNGYNTPAAMGNATVL